MPGFGNNRRPLGKSPVSGSGATSVENTGEMATSTQRTGATGNSSSQVTVNSQNGQPGTPGVATSSISGPAPSVNGALGGPQPVDVRQQAGDLYRGAILRRMQGGAGDAGPELQLPQGSPSSMFSGVQHEIGQGMDGEGPDIKALISSLLGSRNSRRVLGARPGQMTG